MNSSTKRAAVAVALTAAVLMSGTACSKYNDERVKGDAPVAGRAGDDSPAYVTNMPDDFGNIAAKCLVGFPGMATITNTKKRTTAFPYAGCDGKGSAPNPAIGVGSK